MCTEVVNIGTANLACSTELVLAEENGVDMYYMDVLEETGGAPGWEVACRSFLGNITDDCSVSVARALLVGNVQLVQTVEETDALTEKEVDARPGCSTKGKLYLSGY